MAKPYYEQPCAAKPWTSYRYRGAFGWVMIGANSDDEALRQAARSIEGTPKRSALEIWNGRKYVPVTQLPSSHLEAIRAAGFDVLRWQNTSIRVACSNGEERNEWLPVDLIHWERKLFIRWCDDDKYSFAGWESQGFGHFGGRYETVQGALSWFIWFEKQNRRAG